MDTASDTEKNSRAQFNTAWLSTSGTGMSLGRCLLWHNVQRSKTHQGGLSALIVLHHVCKILPHCHIWHIKGTSNIRDSQYYAACFEDIRPQGVKAVKASLTKIRKWPNNPAMIQTRVRQNWPKISDSYSEHKGLWPHHLLPPLQKFIEIVAKSP